MKTILTLLLILAVAHTATAGPTSYYNPNAARTQAFAPSGVDVWGPGSSLGFFGGGLSMSGPAKDSCDCRDGKHSGFGGGIDGDFFFTENFGIRASYGVFAPRPSHHVYDANLILRFPVREYHFAPYVMVGGGFVSDGHRQGQWDVGVGIEFHFADYGGFGLFAEGAFYFDSGAYDHDYSVIRIGIRLPF